MFCNIEMVLRCILSSSITRLRGHFGTQVDTKLPISTVSLPPRLAGQCLKLALLQQSDRTGSVSRSSARNDVGRERLDY